MFSVSASSLFLTGDTPIIGRNYTLNCNYSGVNIPVYQWQKDSMMWEDETGPTLLFSPLKLSHAGLYTCSIGVNTANKELTLESTYT